MWAVGDFDATTSSPQRALIEHWNGKNWSVVSSPAPGQLSILASVGAVSANDIWAVGFYYDTAGNSQTLIVHWNGTSWKVVSSPSPGLTDNALGGVAVVSATDIWAAGSQSSDEENSFQTLIEHWDGTGWSVVPSPSPGSYANGLGAITAISMNNVWAVGGCQNAQSNFAGQTLAEHWDGTSWTVVTTGNVGSGSNGLSGVAPGADSEVWAVGSYSNLLGLSQTLIEQWNGTDWNVVTSPNPSSEFNQLASIAEVSNTLWSVGYFATSSVANTLVETACF